MMHGGGERGEWEEIEKSVALLRPFLLSRGAGKPFFFFSWFSVILHNLLFSPSVVYPVFNLGISVVRQLEAFKQRKKKLRAPLGLTAADSINLRNAAAQLPSFPSGNQISASPSFFSSLSFFSHYFCLSLFLYGCIFLLSLFHFCSGSKYLKVVRFPSFCFLSSSQKM